MEKFDLFLDNDGGVVLRTDLHCDYFADMGLLSAAVRKLMAGETSEEWNGNKPELRNVDECEDMFCVISWMDIDDVITFGITNNLDDKTVEFINSLMSNERFKNGKSEPKN